MNGYDRLKEQYLSLTDKDDAIKKITKFLMAQSNMSELYLNEEKNITDMLLYIKDLARKKAINNVAVIEDNEVYSWALKYFEKSNEKLGIKKLSNDSIKKEIKPIDNPTNQLKLELECT